MQNEPINGLLTSAKWQATGWYPSEQRDFLKQDLYPAIKNSSFSNTEIIILDDQRAQLPWWPKIVLSDGNENLDLVTGIGIHWYTDNYYPAKALSLTHKMFPDKFMIGTEACNKLNGGSAIPFLGNWEHGENYSNDILDDLNNYAGGWVDWNMALNLEGKPNWAGNSDDSPIIVDTTNNLFYKNPMFYHLGHFSKFLSRDYRIIGGSTGANRGTGNDVKYIIAASPEFSNEIEKRVVVILNKSENDLDVVVQDKGVGNFRVQVLKRSVVSLKYYV